MPPSESSPHDRRAARGVHVRSVVADLFGSDLGLFALTTLGLMATAVAIVRDYRPNRSGVR